MIGTPGKDVDTTDPIERHLASQLRKLRESQGHSEIKVDSMARLPIGSCKMLERGTAFFGPSQLHALARAFEVDPSYFFDGLPVDGPPMTKETIDLIKAFRHIDDPALRKKILGLLKAVAD